MWMKACCGALEDPMMHEATHAWEPPPFLLISEALVLQAIHFITDGIGHAFMCACVYVSLSLSLCVCV